MVKKINLLQFYGVKDSIEMRKEEIKLEKLQARSLKRAAERQARRDEIEGNELIKVINLKEDE